MIIPTFERVELTKRAVDSVLHQTYSSFFIYIIEDGSNHFASLGHTYQEKFHQVKYISLPKNNGPAFARNYGASLGNSPYIAFLDSDDTWKSQKLDKQISFMKQNPSFLWVHADEVWIKNNTILKQNKKHQKQGGIFIEKLFERCLISSSSVLFCRELWEAQSGFKESFPIAEDYELWIRINFHYKIGYIQEALTVKYAGDWNQLSKQVEIDKYRVLALHRFFRLYSSLPKFLSIKKEWSRNILKKISILKKGALKYQHEQKYKKYVAWEDIFKRISI